MNPSFILRVLGLLFTIQGEANAAKAFLLMADAADSGIEVDEHMRSIDEALKAGVEPDWPDLFQRIQAKTDRILNA